MKHNPIILMTLLLGIALFGCKKQEQEALTPKITNDKVETTVTTATFTWTVDWPGKLISVVEVSKNEDMSHSQFYGSEDETENHNFTVTVTGLEVGTKYYYRYVVWNHFYVDNKFVMEVNFMTITDQTFIVNGVSFTMKRVEGGTFWMGAQSTNPNGQNYDSEAYDRESPVHSVTLSTFYMGETEVTQELWQAVMGSNPSQFSGTNLPVEKVSWNMIVNQFLPALNAATGQNFRLPTEAEWEYAARGGNQGHGYMYAGSNTIGNVAWYDGNSNNQTHSVATKSPNELGLYDMSGNVLEWCQDWYGNYSSGSQTNPQGPSSGSNRVLPGGSWINGARYCRVSDRSSGYPDFASDFSGFRLVLPQ